MKCTTRKTSKLLQAIFTALILPITLLMVSITATACEHSKYDITDFTGDYRYHSDIAEFYDCSSQTKYYVADTGIAEKLKTLYQGLDLMRKDDIYIKVEGYIREEETQIDGVNPAKIFVPVKLLNYDINRGCTLPIRKGY